MPPGRLEELESYVDSDRIREFATKNGFVPVNYQGVYINSADNLIFLRDDGLVWNADGAERRISFASIRAVLYPEDEETRLLKLIFHDGSELDLPVLNETGEYLDFYAFGEFIESVIYWPHQSFDPIDVKEVSNREDLSRFLTEQDEDDRLSNIAFALRQGFPQAWQMQYFDIDPQLIDNPGVWRLLALFMCSSKDFGERRFHYASTRPIKPGRPDDEDIILTSLRTTENLFTEELVNAFGPRTCRVLELAIKEADIRGDTHLGVDALLAGLVQFDRDTACRILGRKGLTPQSVREAIRKILGIGTVYEGSCKLLTVSLIKVINKAVKAKKRTGAEFVEPELLLESLKEREGLAQVILDRFELLVSE